MKLLLALALLLIAAPAFAQTNPILTFGASATHLAWDRQSTPTEARIYVKNCVVASNTPVTCTALPFQVVAPTCTASTTNAAVTTCKLPITELKLTGLHEIRVCEVYAAIEGAQEFCADLASRVRVMVGLEPKNVALLAK